MSLPFLALFLCGFGYVGWVSLWQGGVGLALRQALGGRRRGVAVVPPPSYAVLRNQGADGADVLAGEIVVADASLRAPETA